MDELPLQGRTIVVTRSAKQGTAFCQELKRLGAKTLALPMIAIVPPQDPAPFYQAVQRIEEYDWVMVTSQNGVKALLEALARFQLEPSRLPNRFVTVGKKTKQALEAAGITVDLMPDKFVAEEIWALMQGQVKAGEKALYLRGNLARPYLCEQLTAAGLEVEAPVCYETVPARQSLPPLLEALQSEQVDVITFTSPSTVHFMMAGLQEELGDEERVAPLLQGVKLVAIGPITAQAFAEHQLPMAAMAEEHTVDGMVSTLIQLYTKTSE